MASWIEGRRDRREAVRDVGGDDRPSPGWGAQAFATEGRSGAESESLSRSKISIRTWADWDDKVPELMEIDLVGHQGGDSRGEFAQILTVTDVFTGWTETKAVRNKAQRWVFAALVDLRGNPKPRAISTMPARR